MRTVRDFVRGTLERMLGRLADGPAPPPRLREGATFFRVQYPAATVDEWERFAALHAEEAYRAGFIRGLEWSERELDRMDPDTPERIADSLRHDWSLARSIPSMRETLDKRVDLNDPFAGIPPEQRVEVARELAAYFGGFEVVVTPGDTGDDDAA